MTWAVGEVLSYSRRVPVPMSLPTPVGAGISGIIASRSSSQVLAHGKRAGMVGVGDGGGDGDDVSASTGVGEVMRR
jgi:hypothetical protein